MISFEWVPPFIGLALFLGAAWLLFRGARIVLRHSARKWPVVVLTLSLATWVSALTGLQEPESTLLVGLIGTLMIAGPIIAILMLRDFLIASARPD